MEAVGEKFVARSFDVYSPKAIAGINHLPGALASRCISILMFRALPGSAKLRRRLDTPPVGWVELRDDLHALALTHGRQVVELARRMDLCEAMSGRDLEVWQPIHALAQLVEDSGATHLVEAVRRHTRACIEEGKDEAIAGADEALLRLLAQEVTAGRPGELTPRKLLDKARETDGVTFQRYSPAGVGRVLKRYGIRSTPGNQRTYRDVTVEQLRRIENSYGVDLGIGPAEPSYPSEVSAEAALTQAGDGEQAAMPQVFGAVQ